MTESLPLTTTQSTALFPYFGTGSGSHAHYASRRSELQGILQVEHGRNTIDVARAVLLERVYGSDAPFQVFVFIDSDISFSRADYDCLVGSCLETRGVVGVPYITKRLDGLQQLACDIRTDDLEPRNFYEQGACYPARYVGMGFTAIHREAVDRIVASERMDRVSFGSVQGMTAYPLFMPLIVDGQYLHEDYAFCERAKRSGVGLFAETRPRGIRHHGEHAYRVEDLDLVSYHHPSLSLVQQPQIQRLSDAPDAPSQKAIDKSEA